MVLSRWSRCRLGLQRKRCRYGRQLRRRAKVQEPCTSRRKVCTVRAVTPQLLTEALLPAAAGCGGWQSPEGGEGCELSVLCREQVHCSAASVSTSRACWTSDCSKAQASSTARM